MATQQVEAILSEFAQVQQTILAELAQLPREELRFAADNVRWNTVRRVLLRFGDHVREHTTQLVAAREATGAAQTMPQRMLARAMEAYGCFLGAVVGLTDEALDRAPEAGEWTPRQILEHMTAVQRQYLELIRRAREEGRAVEAD